MENKFSPDLPDDVCPSCALVNSIGARDGARVIFCEHSWRAYTRPEENAPWRRCRIADVISLTHVADPGGRLHKLLTAGEAHKGVAIH